MSVNLRDLTDAVAGSVAREIATLRQAAQQERELRDAEHRARVAELDVAVTAFNSKMAERLASVKDGSPGASVTVEDVAPLISHEVERIVALIPPAQPGEPGKSVERAEVEAIVADTVSSAVAALPVQEMIAAEVEKIPPAQPGEPGRDADPELVASLVKETVERAVAALPVPKDADPMDVAAIVDAKFKDDLDEIRASIDANAFVPDDVAANIALAVRMMAETPQTRQEAQPINVYSNVTMPEMKAADTTVNVSVPERAAPVVNMAAPVVNVGQPNVIIEAKRTKEVTKVTKHDKSGRIVEFEKSEVDE